MGWAGRNAQSASTPETCRPRCRISVRQNRTSRLIYRWAGEVSRTRALANLSPCVDHIKFRRGSLASINERLPHDLITQRTRRRRRRLRHRPVSGFKVWSSLITCRTIDISARWYRRRRHSQQKSTCVMALHILERRWISLSWTTTISTKPLTIPCQVDGIQALRDWRRRNVFLRFNKCCCRTGYGGNIENIVSNHKW